MKSSNQAEIREAFSRQAGGFESDRMNFSNKEYLSYAVSKIAPKKTDTVLEVAAGTCAFGRAIAPYVAGVTCLEMTPAMLSVGKEAAEKEHIGNISFVVGDAAGLPFSDRSFDIVLSRLAFHHFPDINQPFAEMVRVLKPGGELVLIDMEAAEEPLRKIKDSIEKMRDSSHVRSLSREETRSVESRKFSMLLLSIFWNIGAATHRNILASLSDSFMICSDSKSLVVIASNTAPLALCLSLSTALSV